MIKDLPNKITITIRELNIRDSLWVVITGEDDFYGVVLSSGGIRLEKLKNNKIRWILAKSMLYSYKFYEILVEDYIEPIKYWIYYRIHPSHRYNVVKTGLKPGYYDADTRMIHACFTLLKEYVEHELSCFWLHRYDSGFYGDIEKTESLIVDIKTGNIASNLSSNSLEALELYLWWIKREKIKTIVEGSDYGNDFIDKELGINFNETTYMDIEDLISKQDDVMMGRLMKIRTSLWT